MTRLNYQSAFVHHYGGGGQVTARTSALRPPGLHSAHWEFRGLLHMCMYVRI